MHGFILGVIVGLFILFAALIAIIAWNFFIAVWLYNHFGWPRYIGRGG